MAFRPIWTPEEDQAIYDGWGDDADLDAIAATASKISGVARTANAVMNRASRLRLPHRARKPHQVETWWVLH